MHRHVRIVFFRHPIVNLITSRFHCFSTYSNDGFNPPCIFVFAMHSRWHSLPVSVSQHIPSLSPNTARCPLYYLSTPDDRTMQISEHVKHAHSASISQSNNNPKPSPAHRHHCKPRCDFDSVRCRSAVALALFSFVVSHDHSTLTSMRPLLPGCCLPVSRRIGIK